MTCLEEKKHFCDDHYRFPDLTIAEGRRAAENFKMKYGVDFTDLEDEGYYRDITERDGVIFRPFTLNTDTFYRVVTMTDMHNATKFNNFISDGGWAVIFMRDYVSTGTVQVKISAGDLSVYGDYGIRTGVNAGEGPQDTSFPGPVMKIHYEPKTVMHAPNPVSMIVTFECLLFNDFLGWGIARGIAVPQVKYAKQVRPSTLWAGGTHLTFPANIPHEQITL